MTSVPSANDGEAANSKPYYPALDSLRFYSAFAVIVTHIELTKGFHDLPTAWHNPFIQNLGPAGVYFFFTLSGFLITRLLLYEDNVTGRISIGNFYVRRSLRIWPLYFACVVLGFYVLPAFSVFDVPSQSNHLKEDFVGKLLLYCAFLPHVAGAIYDKVPNIGHLWSIGVEEVFYVFWPLVVLLFKTSLTRYVSLLLGILLIKTLFFLVYHSALDPSKSLLVWKEIMAASKFECMVIGGIFALPSVEQFSKILSQLRVQMLSLITIPLCFLMYLTTFDDGVFLLFAVAFSVFIWNSCDSKKAINCSNAMCNYLGRISYGIYCYHFLVVSAVINVIPKNWFIEIPVVTNLLVYVCVLSITVAISAISFAYFEAPVNRLKHRFGHSSPHPYNV